MALRGWRPTVTKALTHVAAMAMWLMALPFLASAALADNGHSGVSTPRTGPELSDIALFVIAAIAVWLTRRALRKRSRKG